MSTQSSSSSSTSSPNSVASRGFGGRGPGSGPGGMGSRPTEKPKELSKTAIRLLKYMITNPWYVVAILVCLGCSTGASLVGSYMLRPIINNFIYLGGVNVAGLIQALIILGGIYLVGSIASYGQAAMTVRVSQKGVNRLRKELFDKLQDLPVAYFDRNTHGDIMSRFTNDADTVQTALEQSVIALFSSVITFVGTISIMIFTNQVLFIPTIFILAGVLSFLVHRGKLSQGYYRKQQAALGAVNADIQENIEGLKVVKAFCHEQELKDGFEKKNDTFREAASNATYYSSSVMPFANNLVSIGYAATACLGGILVAFYNFDIGGLVVYLTYTKQVAQPLNQISQQLTMVYSALAGAERIFQAMDEEPEIDEGRVTLVPAKKEADGSITPLPVGTPCKVWAWRAPKGGPLELVPVTEDADGSLVQAASSDIWAWKHEIDGKMEYRRVRGAARSIESEDSYYTELKGAVRFSNVDFSYVPSKPVLQDVSLYADPGEKLAFVGSTGAGKTTITNLINRFYEIQGGFITMDGIDVIRIRKDDLREALGAVLQDIHLFTGTIMDNIRYGRLDATDEECIEAAKSANAHSFIRRLPQGYQTPVSGSGSNLSQGQRQLLAIARAAVKDPPVMILDEATSSIDTRTERHIERGMDTLMEGRTVFVIAHRLSTVRNSHCIIVIEEGRIFEKGNHQELLDIEGRYYQLYTGQFQLT